MARRIPKNKADIGIFETSTKQKKQNCGTALSKSFQFKYT